MDLDDLLGGLARVLGHKLQVGTGLAAVEHGDLQHVAGGNLDLVQLAHESLHTLDQGLIADDAGIIVDHEGAVSGNGLHNAGDLAVLQGDVEGTDLGVDLSADLVAELHRQGGVPGE